MAVMGRRARRNDRPSLHRVFTEGEAAGCDLRRIRRGWRLGSRVAGALRFVVLVGVVNLFADMTYEGARSVTGPFLHSLGATALVVGLVAGFGELIGYALRLVSGYVADRTARYWAVTLAGHAINMLAVPLLALAHRWEMAAALMIAERVGKAIRTPARDAMLSHATKEAGHGWGFGLHEAMDQAGAMIGPLVVAAALAAGWGYRTGFGLLLVPALLALGVLIAAWRAPTRGRRIWSRSGPIGRKMAGPSPASSGYTWRQRAWSPRVMPTSR